MLLRFSAGTAIGVAGIGMVGGGIMGGGDPAPQFLSPRTHRLLIDFSRASLAICRIEPFVLTLDSSRLRAGRAGHQIEFNADSVFHGDGSQQGAVG